MKITSRQLSKYMFWFCILINLHFLYLFSYPSFVNTLFHARIMTGTLALLSFLLVYYCYKGTINYQFKFLKKYCIYILSAFIILFVYTSIYYPLQPLKTTYLSSNNIMVVMWAVSLVVVFKDMNGFHNFARKLNWLLLIWLLLVLMQSILYNISGIFIFNFRDYYAGDVITRNNQLRMTLGGITNAMILYDFDIWFTKKTKKTRLPFLVFLVGIIDVFFVQQTRMYIISIAVGIAVVLLIGSKGKKAKIRNLSILFIVLSVLIFSNSIADFWASFSVNGEYGGNTENRLREIPYYWNYFLEHPIIGMGGVSDAVVGSYRSIVHGPQGWFYLDDVGYFGLLANGGIVVGSIIVAYFWRTAKVIKFLIKKHELSRYSYFAAIVIFLFVSNFTLSSFLTQKVDLMLPIILALGELIYSCEKKKMKEGVA